MRPKLIHTVLAVSIGLVLAGCQTASVKPQQAPQEQAKADQINAQDLAKWRATHLNQQVKKEPEQAKDLWDLTRHHLELEPTIDQPRVDAVLAEYRRNDSFVRHASDRANLYYYFVLGEVLKREMPAEIALLPFVESGYNPLAVSPSHAAGAWQFIPSTAQLFKLKRNWWYDGRQDIVASTNAALDYLQYLNDRFDGDWLLSLAAYNCGEGCVGRSVKRNQRAGKATDYWSLRLPRETQRYVPKLIAMARLVDRADEYGITLPAMPNTPYFEMVDIDSQVELIKAAKMAGIDLELMKKLNPGFRQWATDPSGPHRLLLPSGKGQQFQLALSKLPASQRVTWTRYEIRSGDTLSQIARRFDTTVEVIRKGNKLSSNRIRTGKTLLIPTRSSTTTLASNASTQQVHQVRSGENLWKIAQHYGISADQLADWNQISDSRSIQPGQNLILYPDSSNPG
ncbi:LysM peptidoglycan-binding domain-containing protein [Marinobacterium mangrovicola]|uniref:Membrane-bound lytic murein transglycosylase D n=1 Tax=Marinobacterium mangrovicola TaxID=1476959 RepID=A0A4R1GNE8_9GAMM|nr:LysM peptidoglycan-binding domain-containing protein [Marinobacterium mangrovicola]TCK08861.1 membrane-bound lytic murein transglycosylase D [Marinobacterium mangrovicola]